ncbi:MAG: cytochrome c [Deltaproteobacteria bacterium]|nr:cytochrome c [Deltaproteobacteria bacterium]
MKRIFTAVLIAGAAATFAACHHQGGHHAESGDMHGHHGISTPDERITLKLPHELKAMQKRMMVKHMDSLAEITAAISANELDKAAKIAKENLGTSEEEAVMCRKLSDKSGEAELFTLGMDTHKKADELSENAAKGDREAALKSLAALTKSCNACHERYKH